MNAVKNTLLVLATLTGVGLILAFLFMYWNPRAAVQFFPSGMVAKVLFIREQLDFGNEKSHLHEARMALERDDMIKSMEGGL